MKKVSIMLVFLVGVISLSASGKKDDVQTGKPLLAVSILPQSYFAQEIAKDSVELLVLVGEGQSPHSYEPTPLQIAKLSSAKAWVTSGTDFEISFITKVNAQFPSVAVIDGTRGMSFRKLNDWEAEPESEHEAEGDEHGEHDVDRHTWLGKDNAKIMISTILRCLIELNPSMKDVYEENCRILLTSVDETFILLHDQLSPLKGKSILVFHPSFGYFLDEFGILQLSVETGGKEPSARILAELIDRVKKDQIPALFVQKQFPVAAAQKIANETGAKVVALDPLAEDWRTNLLSIGNALKDVYNK